MADEYEDDDDFLRSLETETEDEPEEEKEEQKSVTYTAEDLEKVRAEAIAAAKAEVEASFNERRSYFDRRENDRQKALRERGLMIGDDGTIAVSDPQKVLGSLLGVQPQQQAKTADEDAEPEIDQYDPASIRAHSLWAARQAAKALEASIEAKYAPLRAAQQTLLMPRAQEAAKAFLARQGAEDLISTPEFLQPFQFAMSKLDEAAQADPAQAREAAGWAMARVPDEVFDRVKSEAATRKAEAAAQAERDRQREMQQQNQSSNGIRTTSVNQPTFVSQNEENDRQSRAIREALGDNAEAMAALKLVDAGPMKNGSSAMEMYNARQRQKAGRR